MTEPTNSLRSTASELTNPEGHQEAPARAPARWLQVGVIAAASGLLGGLAAAWYYRKTLARLREFEHEPPESRIMDASPEDF